MDKKKIALSIKTLWKEIMKKILFFLGVEVDDYTIIRNHSECIGCGLCVNCCPAGAIILNKK